MLRPATALLIVLSGCGSDWRSRAKPADAGVPGAAVSERLELARLEAEEIRGRVSVGRFQVINGSPSTTRNIMLLDTSTGNTWVICNGPNDETTWCWVERSDGSAVPSRPKPKR